MIPYCCHLYCYFLLLIFFFSLLSTTTIAESEGGCTTTTTTTDNEKITTTTSSSSSSSSPTTLVVIDTTTSIQPFDTSYWKRSFGSGHATLTLRKDWQRQLQQGIVDLGLRGIRHHGIFDDDMSVVVGPRQRQKQEEEDDGDVDHGQRQRQRPRYIYNFTLVEQSWKFQVENNVTPFVELSFMPAFLANCTWTSPKNKTIVVNPNHKPCPTMFGYAFVKSLPTSLEDWYDLVQALVQHAVDTFGLSEVQKWHFECWNELWGFEKRPWDDYIRFYNATAVAVKSVHPTLKVGGPATMQLQHLTDFVQNVTALGIPMDFVSTHMYPTDPQCPGNGRHPNDHASNWGPDCFPTKVQQAKRRIQRYAPNVSLMMTEYNVGCCIGYPQHDTSAAAAFIFRTIPQLADGLVDVLSWWTFSDIFEEGKLMPDTDDDRAEFQNLYGLMTINGIPKPGWRAFQLLHQHVGNFRYHNVSIHEQQEQQQHDGEEPSSSLDHQCSIEDGVNMKGFDLEKAPTAKTIDDCCQACKNQSSCSFWSFVPLPTTVEQEQQQQQGSSKPTCFLKTSDAGRSVQKGVVSGSREPPPPPAKRTNRISAMATTTTLSSTTGDGGDDDDGGIAVFLSYWSHLKSDHNRTAKIILLSDKAHGGTSSSHYPTTTTTTTNMKATEYRIDDTHANAFTVWHDDMGKPSKPNPTQLKKLIQASQVVPKSIPIQADDGSVEVFMPPNSAVLIIFQQHQYQLQGSDDALLMKRSSE